ncbi:MAG: dTMP kinase [Patescibacteria group bacterium]|nr:MAG: dTMP kinase [Patescibacteria group bacterium]
MPRGKFIAIEGGEGSGKTKNIEYLKKALGGEGIVFTREPGGTLVAEKIRELLFSKDPNEEMEVETELLLFFAARIQHIKKLIIPALESGKHVICDRFNFSTYAYQVVARGRRDLEDTFHVLDAFARGGIIKNRKWIHTIEPNLYIFLDVSPRVGLARVASRGEETTRFDEESLDFHKRVAEGLRRAACGKPNAVVVDAEAEFDEVARNVLAHIKCTLNIEK